MLIKLLFICSQNRLRSPTAESIFSSYDGVEAISAGTNNDSDTVVSGDLIEWADIVFVMESIHRSKVTRKFNHYFKNKRLVVLDIPDNFEFMDESLIEILKTKVSRYVQFN